MKNISYSPGLFSPSKQIRDKSHLLYQLLLIPLMILLLSGEACIPDVKEYTPESGSYPGPITVSLNIPDATAIYYTLDGTEPAENCLEYLGPFQISQTTVLKYKAFRGSVAAETVAVSYTIAGSGGGGTDYTNGDMVNAWYEYEAATRQLLMDKYFGGCEPVVRCGGGLNLNDMGTWILCEDNSITNIEACETAGHGWISWVVAQEGLGGKSTFTYRNYSHTSSQGCELSATGKIVGHFNSGGTGFTTTGEGETIQLSGCYNGTIDDSVKITSRQKTGGFYEATCSATGCSDNTETYLVSPGPEFTLFQTGEKSCTAPYYVIRSQYNNRCLQSTAENTLLGTLYCSGSVDQRWNILPDLSTTATNDYKIQLVDGNTCIYAASPPLLGWKQFEATACEIGSPSQRFTFLNTGENVNIQAVSGAFGDSSEPCVAVSLIWKPDNNVFGFGCNQTHTQWGIYLDGRFPAVDPATAFPQE